MIEITSKGDFKNTEDFIKKFITGSVFSDLDRYGRMGVDALSKATPIDTGLTADSWVYRIIKTRKSAGIEWSNTNRVKGIPVVILIQYGHATGTGGYVAGRDFINPAIRPIFDQISDHVWKRVIA